MQVGHIIPEPLKQACDVGAITGLLLSITGVLTPVVSLVASLFTVFWMGIRVYETDTIQKVLGHPLKGKNDEADK